MRTASVILCLFAAFVLYTDAFHEVEFAGHELLDRPILVQTGRRMILLKHISFRKGQILAFHAMFNSSSKVHFQLWRRMWSQTQEELYQLVMDRHIISRPGNFTLDVSADAMSTEEGDRFGFLHDGVGQAPIVASLSSAATDTLFHQLDAFDPLPKVEEVVAFDGLAYPYVFSVGASYAPDAHDDYLLVGPKGDTGRSGPQGDQGVQGDTGPVGSTGPSGDQGDTGTPGPGGYTGDTGHTGLLGPPGEQGHTGPVGNTGEVGDTGEVGPPGDVGATGHTGVPGDTGPPGYTGESGSQGATGPPGATGHTGGDGATGATGATGPSGPSGEPGAMGASGPYGYTGPKGNPGPIGAQGPPGILDLASLSSVCNSSLLQCQQSCTGSYGEEHCDCKPGWQLNTDGKSCDDLNECDVNNGGCEMTCVNIQGSFRCQCGSGTKVSPNGLSCVDISECDVDNGECGEAVCVDLYGKHVCVNSDSGYNVLGSESSRIIGTLAEASMVEEEEDDLLNRKVVLGLLIWLAVLTLIVIILFICILVQRRKINQEKKMYRMVSNYINKDPGTGQYGQSEAHMMY